MLSKAQNQLLCDVSPGAPMHRVFKSFWLPVVRGPRLVAGGAPVKLRILSEDYVAFRAHDGRVAVFDERCPHRRCSLTIAHNSDNALRCLFHGWKFDVSGKCVETPNEPDPKFAARVRVGHYPVREAGGVLWTYFGGGDPPPFPDLIFNRCPPDRVLARAAICRFNWLTGLEAILDPSHVGVLHQNWVEQAPNQGFSADIKQMSQNLAPRLEMQPTEYGFRYAAIRDMPDGGRYLRITEHVAPLGCFIANSRATRKLFIGSVPIDNENSIQWYFWHSPPEPLPEEDRRYAIGGTDPDDDDMFRSAKGLPLWGQDRDAMTQGRSFSGFSDIQFEDFIAGEAQGAIPDRQNETVCTGDMAIIYARRQMLDKLQRLQAGDEQAFAHGRNVDYGAIQAVAAQVRRDDDWRAIAEERMRERTR